MLTSLLQNYRLVKDYLNGNGDAHLIKAKSTAQPFVIEGKKVKFFIEKGSCGPGPTYSTLDIAYYLSDGEQLPKNVYLINFDILQHDKPVLRHLANYTRAVAGHDLPIRVLDFQDMIDHEEPAIWITGFTVITPDKFRSWPKIILPGTVIMATNGIFGPPSYYSVKNIDGTWTDRKIAKTINSSLPPVAKPPIKRLILNNPFNWVISPDVQIVADCILKLIADIQSDRFETLLIVSATDTHKTMLHNALVKSKVIVSSKIKEKLNILAPQQIRLKDVICPSDLVISEGLGTMGDCLISGATGIQIINPRSGISCNTYSYLHETAVSDENKSMLRTLKSPDTNFESVKTLINACCSTKEVSDNLFERYRRIFINHREQLIRAPGNSIEEALISDYVAQQDIELKNPTPEVNKKKLGVSHKK